MRRTSSPETALERLARYLLDGNPTDPFAVELVEWLEQSPRFRSFAELHRAKIRKKLRSAADAEARRDVRAELRVAHLLLAEARIDLAFEAYGSTKGGPDFTVALRGERSFNLEVTRVRRPPADVTDGGPLLTKLRQLPPSMPNVLLMAIGGDRASAVDVQTAVRAVRRRADGKDEPFFAYRGFTGTRDFYDRFRRLSAVLIWCEGATGDDRATLWTNRSARIALPERAARLCLAGLRAT